MVSLIIIPIVAALVGWITNVIAIKMTFYPLEFKGHPLENTPHPAIKGIGWQGIIPSKAGKIAGISVDLLTSKLVDVKEQFSKIDPEIVSKEMQPTVARLSKNIINEAMTDQIPLLWKVLPEFRKKAIYSSAAKEFPLVTKTIMTEVRDNITDLFDLKNMAVESLVKNPQLLNELFLKCGKQEFKFIERSGIYFGFLFGIIQMFIWNFYPAWWILPVGGLIVGFATNWLALKMIFEPTDPIKFGPIKIQGLFIKRQQEVAVEYAKIVAGNIMTVDKIFDRLLNSQNSDKLVKIVTENVLNGVDKTAGFHKSIIQISAGSEKYDAIKQTVLTRFLEELPKSVKQIFDYAGEALDLEYTLKERMSALAPSDFVGVLRPAFQEDEWILILVGTALGCGAGFLQLFFLL